MRRIRAVLLNLALIVAAVLGTWLVPPPRAHSLPRDMILVGASWNDPITPQSAPVPDADNARGAQLIGGVIAERLARAAP